MEPTEREPLEDILRSVTSELFEDLCLELLRSMGFRSTYRVGHHRDRDRGRDIEATYPRILPDGHNQINERWFFECKHHQNNLNVDDILNKVAWAEASGADFLVILSLTDLTSSARQYITEYQEKHNLRILTWTGKDLFKRFKQHPQAIKELIPFSQFEPAIQIQLEAEERIALARNILTTIGVVTPELDPITFKLLEEIISRCVKKEDVKSISIDSLEDGASEIVYLLSANTNKLLNESELFNALASILDRHPDNDIAWQIARYFRSIKDHSDKRPIRYILAGPIASGKSSILITLLFEMLRDRRFTFEAETLFSFSGMHHMLRDGVIRLRDGDGIVNRTSTGGLHRIRMNLAHGKANSLIEFFDTSGEDFHYPKDHAFPELEGLLDRGDKLLLIFDPSRRVVLDEDDEGDVLPCVFDEKSCDEYCEFLKWAERLGLSIIPVVTKVDLISTEDLNEKIIPTLSSFLPKCSDLIFTTSVLKKQRGQFIPQTFGITQLISLIANEV
jgi:hypothetical protein